MDKQSVIRDKQSVLEEAIQYLEDEGYPVEFVRAARAQLAAAAQREAELRAMLEEMYNYWYEPTKSDINLDGITLKQKAARLLGLPVDAEVKSPIFACSECGGEVGHRANCSQGIYFTA